MQPRKLLVANRGEIAVRILRTAAEQGWQTVAVHPADDATSLHTRKADEVCVLPGRGVAAYLDQDAMLAAAREVGAMAIHPGYGFLSENAEFARQCELAGVAFVGPAADTLALFGDKHSARELARQSDVPIIRGTAAPTSLTDAKAFLAELGSGGALMIKAVAGGGGRGMRPVFSHDELEPAYERCTSEAQAAFGNGDVFVERLVRRARHIEVQVIGDGSDVSHLWERDCSLQRRRQKIVEIAPAPNLEPALRDQLISAALRLASCANYRSLGTIEFLVDTASGEFFFIEANPRLQVEHTVTEEVTGHDLVALQLAMVSGETLASLGLAAGHIPEPRGMALQVRINTETMTDTGDVRPGGGVLAAYAPPSGHGIRVDGYGYVGYRTNPSYDSLLAKLVVHSPKAAFSDVLAKAYRALCEFQIDGAPTNASFLKALLTHNAVKDGAVDTGFVEANAAELLAVSENAHPNLYFAAASGTAPEKAKGQAGARMNSDDPLAVLDYGQAQTSASGAALAKSQDEIADGLIAVRAPLQGTVISVSVDEGQQVARGAQLAVMEAMKMEHVIIAEQSGTIATLAVAEGDTIWEDQLIVALSPSDDGGEESAAEDDIDLDHIRPDLAELLQRRALTRDDNRPDAVARRRKTNQRTVRENVADLFDPETFVEYGPLVVAAQRQRRSMDDLVKRSPADGMIAGVGQINSELFPDPDNRAAVMAYDYTVFAGTQGVHNHWKTDRILDVAERGRMPLVVFAEGGGGRPGESDYGGFVGQNTFQHFGQLSGLVPLIGIVSGRCFAGNAALLGCCDVIIATANANIGMGGPAMIEGGGLGVFTPEQVGSMADQVPNGVVDIAVSDEAEAVSVAKRYLSYFQGRIADWEAPDQRR
ncbi:MAG: biotin carboxylase N-terminal domain-containing protein, partial [Pseudomonadota bacterium]